MSMSIETEMAKLYEERKAWLTANSDIVSEKERKEKMKEYDKKLAPYIKKVKENAGVKIIDNYVGISAILVGYGISVLVLSKLFY